VASAKPWAMLARRSSNKANIGKALEEERKDEETDELGDEELGVESKLLAHLGRRVLETVDDATLGGGQEETRIHTQWKKGEHGTVFTAP